jgi:peptidoglycan/LPS O-acetylase OafA/YrhL
MGRSISYRPELDGLRGFAAIIVVISHASNVSGLWGALLGEGGGQLGVMLFFILSGFLMGSIYLPRRCSTKEGIAYAGHRIARVVPLFYFVVILSLVLTLLGSYLRQDLSFYPISLSNVLTHLAFVRGESALWTIPVEVQFYVIFVALWWLSRGSIWPILLALCPCLAVYGFIGDAPPYWQIFLLFAGFFLTGMVVSIVCREAKIVHASLVWSAAFIVALAGLICLFPNVGHLIGLTLTTRWQNPAYLIVCAALFVTVLYAPIARYVFGNRLMIFAGAISYSIYLLHLPLLTYLGRALSPTQWPLSFTALGLATTVVLATASYRWVEAPARRTVRAWFSSGEGSTRHPPTQAAAAPVRSDI